MRILLFEDEPGLIDCLSDMLEARGHEVTTLIGVQRLRQRRVFGIAPDGSSLDVAVGDYDFSVVDGMLAGRYQGWEIVPYLTAQGLSCIAHSGEDALNRRMKEKGATHQALKNGTRGLRAVIEEIEGKR